MLELIFQGFFEWMYGLILEAWEYFAFAILDVMSLDFAYLESHIPVMSSIRQVLLAGGWALLIGNLVFQAIKSMTVGLGFEGEDPKLLFTRTFVFSFLLVASPQICDLCLNMTSILMQTMEVPDAVDVHLVDSSAFGSLTVSWLLIIIFNLIIMYQVFKLLVEVAERYVILGVLTMVAPLAFGVGGSKSTSDIFTGWCRMYGSMCVLMVSHVIFLNMLLSVLSAVPSGLDTFLWMILLLAIVKTAKKSDSIITRIGLNPAFTGDALHVLPGALSYVLLHQATSQITKSLGKATGGTGRGRASGNSPPGKGPRSGGPRGAGTGSPGGSSYSYSNPSTANASSTSSSSYSGSTFSETSSTLTPPGGDTPQQPGGSKPSYGPVAPDNPMPTQKPHIQPKGRDSMAQPPGQKVDSEPAPSKHPVMREKITPHSAIAPAGVPQNSTTDQPGTAGTGGAPMIHKQSVSPSTQKGQTPTGQAIQSQPQTTECRKGDSPEKTSPSPLRASQARQSVEGKVDPGSAVTTQENGVTTRFSRRSTQSLGRVSALKIQPVQSSKESATKDGGGETKPQGTRFTALEAKTSALGSSDIPAKPGSGSARQDRATRQITRPSVGRDSDPQRVPTPPSPSSAVPTRPTPEAPTPHPGTAGKISSLSTPPASMPAKQSKPVSTPTKLPATPESFSPARQETLLSTSSSSSISEVSSRISHGTAGMEAASSTPLPDRASRYSKREGIVSTPKAPTTEARCSSAQQERPPSVSAQPWPSPPTVQPSPGTAGTMPSPGRTVSPIQSGESPARAVSHVPVSPVSPVTPPTARQDPTPAKVVPSVKSVSAPKDTRLKKGYPAKPNKGGKKRHGR
ncbi:MAG: hypothetical protein HFF06_03865 [Oscillospiraceae bacterium]|nr:hypothetical protein [Oscillospiraceae bacterium]